MRVEEKRRDTDRFSTDTGFSKFAFIDNSTHNIVLKKEIKRGGLLGIYTVLIQNHNKICKSQADLINKFLRPEVRIYFSCCLK